MGNIDITITGTTPYRTEGEVEPTPKEIEQAMGEIERLEAEKVEIEELISIAGKFQKFEGHWRLGALNDWKGKLSKSGQVAFEDHVSDHDFTVLMGSTCMDTIVENMKGKLTQIEYDIKIGQLKVAYMWELHREWKVVHPERGTEGRFKIGSCIEEGVPKTLVVGGIYFRISSTNEIIDYKPYVRENFKLSSDSDMSFRC